MDKGWIFSFHFCHATNLVHIHTYIYIYIYMYVCMYVCLPHSSVRPSIHLFIHPSIPVTHTPSFIPHPLLFDWVLWASPLLLLCCCFRPSSPRPPFCRLPACLPFSLHPKKTYHFCCCCCCCFCCILSISPLLLLLLLHFSFHIVGLFAAVKSLPTFSRFLQSIKF